MNRSILKRLAAISPLEDCEGKSHYITPTHTKVQSKEQLCEKMEIEYFEKDVFKYLIFLASKVETFYLMISRQGYKLSKL